jgi:hypothetical protein
LGQQEKVGTATRHHAALTGLINEYCHAAGEVGVGLDEVVCNPFTFEVFTGQVAQAIAANLADEMSIEAASTRPHGNIGGTTAGVQKHFAKRVATFQYFVVGADEHIPGEISNDTQAHASNAI